MKFGLNSRLRFIVAMALAGMILPGSEGMAQRGGRGGGGGASARASSSSSSGGFQAAGGMHRGGGMQGRGMAGGGMQGFGMPGLGMPGFGMPGEMPGVMQQNGAQHCSVTVSENGKTTSVTQDPQRGIQVIFSEEVDGREVRDIIEAANPMELMRKRPEAFEAYQRLIMGVPNGAAARGDGAAARGDGAAARGDGAAARGDGAAARGDGAAARGDGAAARAGREARVEDRAEAKDGARSISVSRLGKTVTITEDDEKGITVALKERVGGREVISEVNAANPAELKRKNEMAHRLYQQYSGGMTPVADGGKGGGPMGEAGVEARGGVARGARPGDAEIPRGDARVQLRAELMRQAEEHADNPQMQILIQKMLKELDE
jgi:hypothetical protein